MFEISQEFGIWLTAYTQVFWNKLRCFGKKKKKKKKYFKLILHFFSSQTSITFLLEQVNNYGINEVIECQIWILLLAVYKLINGYNATLGYS